MPYLELAKYGKRAPRLGTLKELVRSYRTVTKDLERVMTPARAIDRSWGIPCSGQQVDAARHRGQ